MSDEVEQAPRPRVRIQVIEKLGELLEAFTPQHPVWQLNELERHLGWDKATTYRFLRALEDTKILDRYDDGSYTVGVLSLQLAGTYIRHNPTVGAINRSAQAIARETGLTVQIGMLVDREVVVIGSVEGGLTLRAASTLGERLPLHATAAGKAVLSQLSEKDAKALLPRTLPAVTQHTITTKMQLMREVKAARESGMAQAHSELVEGLWAVAVGLPAGILGRSPGTVACAGPPPGAEAPDWGLAERLLRELREERLEHAKLMQGLAESALIPAGLAVDGSAVEVT